MQRLGVYGGSFDPIHYGHLLLAERCREQLGLDQVWFVPAAVSPHKLHHAPASAAARLEMLRLAIAGHDAFHVSSQEIDRGGASYTVETLERLASERPDCELTLLLGADALHDFSTWREPQRICQLARLGVVHRKGSPPAEISVVESLLPADRPREQSFQVVEMPTIELSSRDIRDRLATSRSVRYMLPRAVEMYLATAGLYRHAPAES